MEAKNFGKLVSNPKDIAKLSEQLCCMLNLAKIDAFLGNHPVNLSLSNMKMLLSKQYFVCEKSDGIRIMLYVTNKRLFLYDRLNNFYLTDFMINTDGNFLFDGELYIEDKQNIYSIFDVIYYLNKPIFTLHLNQRLVYASNFVKMILPKNIFYRNNSIYARIDNFIAKQMYKSYHLKTVVDEIPKLKHNNDGLIFTPVLKSYMFYSRSSILKWKPYNLQTLDLLIRKTEDDGLFKLFTSVYEEQMFQSYSIRLVSKTKVFVDHYFDPDLTFDTDYVIGEFFFDKNESTIDVSDFSIICGAWKLHKVRKDKSEPNNIKIVLDQINNLNNHISVEYLIKATETLRRTFQENDCEENGKRQKIAE